MTTIDKPTPQADLEEVCRLIAEGKKVTDPDCAETHPGTLGAGNPRGFREARPV